MRNVHIVLALVLTGLLLGGCIPSQSQLRMEQDQQEMKRRLAELERNVLGRTQERSQEFEGRLDTLARQMAEQQAALDALRVDLQTVHGRLEDYTRATSQMKEDVNLIREDLNLRISALEDRMSELETRLSEAAATPPAPNPVAAKADSPEALYQQGLDAILRENNFARGREILSEFLERFPDSELAVNAMYWVGEAYYGEKKYENAILQFQDVIQQYGDHPKSAAAMLKQALAFDALDDRQNARVIMQKVADSYPLSDEAKKAEDFLAKWQ